MDVARRHEWDTASPSGRKSAARRGPSELSVNRRRAHSHAFIVRVTTMTAIVLNGPLAAESE